MAIQESVPGQSRERRQCQDASHGYGAICRNGCRDQPPRCGQLSAADCHGSQNEQSNAGLDMGDVDIGDLKWGGESRARGQLERTRDPPERNERSRAG